MYNLLSGHKLNTLIIAKMHLSNFFSEELDYDDVLRETESNNCTVYVGGIPANCQGTIISFFFEFALAKNCCQSFSSSHKFSLNGILWDLLNLTQLS